MDVRTTHIHLAIFMLALVRAIVKKYRERTPNLGNVDTVTILNIEERAESLTKLYREKLRGLLVEHGLPDAIESIDRSEENLRAAIGRDTTLSIGFLGESQVGKSSIINALVGHRVLPSGGIGPLTAQATAVSYRNRNGFEVKYHGRDRLNQMRLVIQTALVRQGSLSWEIDDPEARQNHDLQLEIEREEGPPKESSKTDQFIASVRLMLRHSDVPEPETLSNEAILNALRLMQGQPPIGASPEIEPFMPAIMRVRAALGESETIEADENDPSLFFDELELRAAGWMSPLVQRLEVGLEEKWLLGLQLVDLPGMNNFQDAGGSVAQEFIRKKEAGGLLLVLRNNGITENLKETLVDVLDRYGVIERLLWGSNDQAPSVHLGILVTRLDDVAKEHRARIREEIQRGIKKPLPRSDELFAELAMKMEATVREQFRQAVQARLEEEGASGSEMKRSRVSEICEALEKDLEVICVAAPDYLELQYDDAEATVLKTKEATNIPRLANYLHQLAQDAAAAREREIATAFHDLQYELNLHLASVRRAYGEGGGRLALEYERFRETLEPIRAKLSIKVRNAHETAQQLLYEELSSSINDVLNVAKDAGQRRLLRLRKNAESMYWASLDAALRHDGHWTTSHGRTLSYPDELRRAITEEISGHWEPKVVQTFRQVMDHLVEEDLSYVEQLYEKAREAGAHLVDEQHIEEQKQILRTAKNSSVRWTNDRLAAFTEDVRTRLYSPILEPLKEACEAARLAGKNRGQGAKKRIIETLEEGGKHAVAEAVSAAQDVLKRHYDDLLDEVRKSYLREGHDPVAVAFERLTQGEMDAQADAAQRKRVLDAIGHAQTQLSHLVPLEKAS